MEAATPHPDVSLPQDRSPRQQARRNLALPGIEAPVGPSVEDVLLLHRGPDGFVSFHVRRPGAEAVTDLCAVRVEALTQWFPEFREQLLADSFVGINTMFAARTYRHARSTELVPAIIEGQRVRVEVERACRAPLRSGVTGLPLPLRRSDAVRWLNACYVDIDDRAGLGSAALLAGLRQTQAEGVVPRPSFLVSSGRGLWAFWLLVDERNPESGRTVLHRAVHGPDTPLRASPFAVDLHQRVNRELLRRLAHLGADPCSADVTRITRVIGSINTKSGATVARLDAGPLTRYALPDLAAALDVGLLQPARVRERRPATTRQRLARIENAKRRVTGPLEDLRLLMRLRGGFHEGHRHNALYWLAVFALRARTSQADVQQEVLAAARACVPPVSDAQARAQTKSAAKNILKYARPPAHRLVIEEVSISPDEQARLHYLRPRQRPKSTRRTLRHAALRTLVTRLGYVPSTDEAATYLTAQGFKADHTTLVRDYRAIGLRSGRRGGRPRKPTLL